MKSTKPQTVFARGVDTGGVFAIAPVASTVQEQPSSNTPQLIARNDSGQIVHSWSIQQTKCTIGSSDHSTIQCTLPGIEPLNTLVIYGARQAFVRALVPNLTQDGVVVNELLLTDHKNHFELAGHRFELLREPRRSSAVVQQASRMRFSVARPFDLPSQANSARYARTAERETAEELADAPWLKSLIERTIEPLEAQIESLLLPVSEYHSQVLQSHDVLKAETAKEQQKQAELTKEVSSIVARQSATMETLGERLRDVNQQLTAIERIIAEDTELELKAKDGISHEINIQRAAIEQLQTGMVAVTESLNQLHDRQHSSQLEQHQWKEEVQTHLHDLTQAVSEIRESTSQGTDSEILSAVQSLQQSHQLAQEEIQQWQYGLHEHLDNIEKRLTELAKATEPITELTTQVERQVAELAAMSLARNEPPKELRDSEEPRKLNGDWLDQWTTNQPGAGREDSDLPDEQAPRSEQFEVDRLAVDGSNVVPQSPLITESRDIPTTVHIPPDSTAGVKEFQELQVFQEFQESRENRGIEQQTGTPSKSLENDEFFFGSESVQAPLLNDSELERETAVGESANLRGGVKSGSNSDEADEVSLPSWWNEDQIEKQPPNTGAEGFRELIVRESDTADLHQPSADELSGANVEADESSGSLESRFNELVSRFGPDKDEQQPVPSSSEKQIEETSVEDYMKSLLARMRGEQPLSTSGQSTQTGSSQIQLPALANAHLQLNAAQQEQSQSEPTPQDPIVMIDPENYVSLTKPPEKSNNMNAMRDLANASARQAIHKNTRQRYLSTSLLKLAICLIGLVVASVLFAINGFALNVGLIATLASLLVAAIWGYDGIMGLKPLFQSALVLAPPQPGDGSSTGDQEASQD